MRKKWMAWMLAMVCAVGSFSVTTAVEQPVRVEAATKKKAPSLSKVYKAVKNAYGKNYLPSVALSKEDVKARYGISSAWYSGVKAEVPLMSAQVDELVIVKAKNASAKRKIKSALLDYQKALKKDTMQYPANQLKIQASRIYVKGNYVCFIMLGVLDNDTLQQEESKVIAAYRKENAKAVTAIQKLFK